MQPIHIRRAIPEDAAVLRDICRTTFYDTYHTQNTKEDMDLYLQHHFTMQEIQQGLQDSLTTFLLAYDGEQLVGYSKLFESNPTVQLRESNMLEIARIYAVKEAIGKGVGRALMQQVIQTALQKNKEGIWLVVWKKNLRAISFYESFGFKKYGEQTFVLGNDVQYDWVMEKQLL